MDAADAEKFDGLFLNVAQQAGSIENILDSFFGFLQRKTDFFTGGQDEEAAEKLVMEYYKKHRKAGQKRRTELQEKNRVADEERKRRAAEQKRKDEEEYERLRAEKQSAETENKIEEVTDEEAARIQQKKAETKKSDDAAEEGEDGKKDGAKSDDEKDDKEPPPLGNGGKADKYTWTQTLSTLEVFVPVKPGVRAKQLICDIGVESLKVGVKGEPLILNGKLHSKVKADDCMWTLIDNKVVQITFEKFDGMKWWNCVMQGDAEIDTKKIVPDNSKLSDLDGETRMTVEKMMYDQRQKAIGKPSSDQEKQHDLLEKFKAAHPEMDFSNAKVNYGSGGGGSFNFN